MRSLLVRPLAVLALSAGLVVGTALPALAHHPELSGSVACTNGQQIITWTIKNSESTSGSNRTMVVDQISVSAGTVVGVAVNAVFPPKPTSGSVKTATTTFSGTNTGPVTLTVRADWIGGSQNVVRTASVTLPGQCTVPTTTTTTTTTTTSTTTTTTTTVPPSHHHHHDRAPADHHHHDRAPADHHHHDRAPADHHHDDRAPADHHHDHHRRRPPATTTTTEPPAKVLGTTLTRDDTPQVLGETATKPGGSLAHTGAALGMLVFVGGALLWLGVPLSRYKRRDGESESNPES